MLLLLLSFITEFRMIFSLLQIWSLLPRFCLDPTDLKTSFPMIARILGSALNERVELRPIVCHALTLLIKRSTNKGKQYCTNLINSFIVLCFVLRGEQLCVESLLKELSSHLVQPVHRP